MYTYQAQTQSTSFRLLRITTEHVPHHYHTTTSSTPAEAVVRAVEAQLWPNVPYHHPLQRLVVRHAPQLDEERVYPQTLAVHDKLRHQDAVRRRLAQSAGPPLNSNPRRVERREGVARKDGGGAGGEW